MELCESCKARSLFIVRHLDNHLSCGAIRSSTGSRLVVEKEIRRIITNADFKRVIYSDFLPMVKISPELKKIGRSVLFGHWNQWAVRDTNTNNQFSRVTENCRVSTIVEQLNGISHTQNGRRHTQGMCSWRSSLNTSMYAMHWLMNIPLEDLRSLSISYNQKKVQLI